jgi:hypothetical protein
VKFRSIAWASVVVVVVAGLGFLAYGMLRPRRDLRVGHVNAAALNYPEGAIPYTLPLKRFVVATSTRVSGCTESQNGEEISGVSIATISESDEMDPDQRYYIYFQSRTGGKSLDYQVESYSNGTVKSVTAAIRDEVPPMTASIAGALVKFVDLPAPPPPPPVSPPGPAPKSNCADINAAIVNGPNDKRLVIQDETIWTPRGPWQPQLIFSAFPASFLQAFHLNAPRWRLPQATIEIEPVAMPASPPVEYYAADSGEKCENDVPPSTRGKLPLDAPPCLARGLVLRHPATGRVRHSVCDAACEASGRLTPYPPTNTTIPQLGTLMQFPVHSGYTQSAAMNVELTPDGAIVRLQLWSGNASSVVDNGRSATSASTSARPSVTEANKRLAECLAAQRAVLDQGQTPVGTCR